MTAGWAARRAQSAQFCTPSQLVVAARADAIPAARYAFSFKLSVTDGDATVVMANDHPESIQRDRARLLDQRLQPSRGLRSSVVTGGEQSDGTLNAVGLDVR
jgi:hypothetical protein